MPIAVEGERGDLGPVLFVFHIEVDPAVVAGVLGDFEALVLFEFALPRGADPEGEKLSGNVGPVFPDLN
jgi:hypothetical protein